MGVIRPSGRKGWLPASESRFNMFARMDPTFFPCAFEPSMATMFGNLFFAQTEEAGRVIVEDVGLSETRCRFAGCREGRFATKAGIKRMIGPS